MAYTQADLDRLKEAYIQEARSVTFADGREVKFESKEALLSVINYVKADLGLDAGRQRIRMKMEKGVE